MSDFTRRPFRAPPHRQQQTSVGDGMLKITESAAETAGNMAGSMNVITNFVSFRDLLDAAEAYLNNHHQEVGEEQRVRVQSLISFCRLSDARLQ